VLVSGYHGGMFGHNTRKVLISFRIVFLTFDLCFRQVTSDSSKGANVMIIRAIVLLLSSKKYYSCLLLTLFQVTCDNPEKAIVKVVEGNKLDET
jgi:hypothetical protein